MNFADSSSRISDRWPDSLPRGISASADPELDVTLTGIGTARMTFEGSLSYSPAMRRIPKALQQDPIVETTFEIRFSATEKAAGDLLPGMLFPNLRTEFGELQNLPASQVPRALRDQDPTLAYLGTRVLRGQKKQLAIGDRVATLSFGKPYPGWHVVKPVIQQVLSALQSTAIIAAVERISLKYTNVLTHGRDANDESVLSASATLGDWPLRSSGKMIRAEIDHRGAVHVVQVIFGADLTITASGQQTTMSGVLVDVDSIRIGPFESFWDNAEKLVEELHEAEKDIFFGVLTPESIDRMKPQYE